MEEVKENLADNSKDHLTLLAIGLDAGFQSKSSFYRVFRKVTGQSPADFKRNANEIKKLDLDLKSAE